MTRKQVAVTQEVYDILLEAKTDMEQELELDNITWSSFLRKLARY